MKTKALHMKLSDKRHNKLKAIAASKEKTMTQLIEDWIDTLPNPTPIEYDLSTT